MRRQESFPWIIVMGGAVLYWTIALGIGIPSLYRLLGPPGPAHRAAAVEARCVQAMSVDGKPIVFGDCFNIRFVPDVPEAVNDFVQTVPYRSGSRITGPDDVPPGRGSDGWIGDQARRHRLHRAGVPRHGTANHAHVPLPRRPRVGSRPQCEDGADDAPLPPARQAAADLITADSAEAARISCCLAVSRPENQSRHLIVSRSKIIIYSLATAGSSAA